MHLIYKKLFPPEIQCDSALNPIPEEYYFENFSNYIQLFDKKLIPYPDINYVNTKLIPHFKESLQTIKENIDIMNKEIENTKKSAQNSLIQTQECLSNEYQMNFFNQNIVQGLKILTPKKEELKRTLLFSQISFFEKRLDLLKKIEKVASYLITTPHYCYINLKFLQSKNEYIQIEPNIYFQYDSIERKVNYLNSYLSLIPKPFSNYEENVDIANRILSQAITLKINDTKCIIDSEEFEILRLFLESNNSPIHFTFISSSAKDVDIQIKMMSNCFLNFCQITSKDDDLFDVIYFLLFRFFFEIFFEKIELSPLKIERTSQIINSNLDSMKNLTLSELGIKSQKDDILSQKVNELFERNPQLNQLRSDFLNCIFLINPIEIFFTIRKIGICLKNIFTNEDDLGVAWKALFAASSIPSVDLIFIKLSEWKELSLISDLYDDVCIIPNKAIEELKHS